jgi:hypothetical protein
MTVKYNYKHNSNCSSYHSGLKSNFDNRLTNTASSSIAAVITPTSAATKVVSTVAMTTVTMATNCNCNNCHS